MLTAGTLLNNWAFAYKVPLSLFIVFRSAGKVHHHVHPKCDVDIFFRFSSLDALWLLLSQEALHLCANCEAQCYSEMKI